MLDELDYKILNFLNINGESTTTEISRKFDIPENVSSMRLYELAKATKHNSFANITLPLRDSSYVYQADINRFGITTFGKSALCNYVVIRSKIRAELWEERFWKVVPIVISLIALIISFAAFYHTLNTDKAIKIELSKETIEKINGIQSSNLLDSKNALEKNGMQQKK